MIAPSALLADWLSTSVFLEGEELGVYCRREENGCRLAIKKADGKAAVLAAVKLR